MGFRSHRNGFHIAYQLLDLLVTLFARFDADFDQRVNAMEIFYRKGLGVGRDGDIAVSRVQCQPVTQVSHSDSESW